MNQPELDWDSPEPEPERDPVIAERIAQQIADHEAQLASVRAAHVDRKPLRDYQVRAVDSVFSTWAGDDDSDPAQSVLVVMPTGVGKTRVACGVIERLRAEGVEGKIMFLAHREELIFQAARHWREVSGEDAEIEMADLRADGQNMFAGGVVVSSVQTQNAGRRKRRMEYFDPNEFALVICDEAHHFVSDTNRRCLNHYKQNPDIRILGMTATPDRADEEALGQVFDAVAFDYEIPDAIEDGWLVPIAARAVHVEGLDYSSIRTTAGDLNGADLAAVLEAETPVHRMVQATIEIMLDLPPNALDGVATCEQQEFTRRMAEIVAEREPRKTLAFTATVKHAQMFADCLNRWVPQCARMVCGETPKEERRKMLADYAAGRFSVLCNVGVACLDSETEILTATGWVGHAEISPSHQVANWEAGRITFSKPLAIEVRDRRPDERMVVLETRNRSIRVTEDHRMLYRTFMQGKFLVSKAGSLVGRAAALPISGQSEPFDLKAEQEVRSKKRRKWHISQNAYALRKNSGLNFHESIAVATKRLSRRESLRRKNPQELTEDDCEFIGFWLGDGNCSPLHRGGVEYKLWQAESYPNLVKWIERLLLRCNVHAVRRMKKPRRPGGSRVVEWSLCRGTGFGPQARRGLYAIEPYLNKGGSPLLWGLDAAQYAALMRGFWMADGDHGDAVSPRKDQWRISNTNRELFDLLQAIGVCRGFRVNINDGKTNTNNGHKPLWKLSVSKRDQHAMTKCRLSFEGGWKPEKVWCVKSKTGFIVTRRRGTVTVTGNTEGFDEPGIELVVMARPTKSRCLYTQMSGRGTRPLPGVVDGLPDAAARRAAIAESAKPMMTIVDFVGNCGRHRLVSAADILGGNYSDEVVEYATRSLADIKMQDPDGKPRLVAEELEAAKAEIEAQRERERQERIKLRVKAKYATAAVEVFDVLDIAPAPARGWDRTRKLSAKQQAFLRRQGINPEDIDYAKGNQLIDNMIGRMKKGLCTWKQARILQRNGIDASDMTKQQASAEIDKIAARQGWGKRR